jgi:hypothetical protein
MPLQRHDDSRAALKPRPSYYTYGLISTIRLSILLQTPLNNDAFQVPVPEPASR